jgi:MYXO-CTERM domain-containing protein
VQVFAAGNQVGPAQLNSGSLQFAGIYFGSLGWETDWQSRTKVLNGRQSNVTQGPFNGTIGYLAFAIYDTPFLSVSSPEVTNIRYGWIQYQGNDRAAGGTILAWAYEDSGAAIVVGAIPAPGALAVLGVAGVAAGRRRR